MKQIKQITVFACMGLLALMPAIAHGADMVARQEYTLQKGSVVEGDLYAAAQSNVVAGDIDGDLVIAGAHTLVTGSVKGDVLAAGGTLELLGSVGDDVRIAGGTITIGKNVDGDVVAAGGVVHIVSGVTVGGDVIIAGGQVIVDGAVKGNVKVAGGEVTINGQVEKDIVVRADKQFTLGKDANSMGSIWYRSPSALVIQEGAKTQNEPTFEKIEHPTRVDKKVQAAIAGLIGAITLIKLLITLITAIVIVTLFKKTAHNLTKIVVDSFGRELVRGFVVLIVAPAAILLAAISVIGIWFAFAGALLYVLLLMVAKVLMGIALGAVAMRSLKKQKELEVNWQSAAIGVVIIELVWLVPVLGWVAVFLLFLATLGSVSLLAYQKAWMKR